MSPKRKPWPIREMSEWYNSGMTLAEIADRLCSEEWQPYWIQNSGSEYRPGQKIVNKTLRKHMTLRSRGAPGSRNGSWKGGRRIDKGGYILVYKPDHPHAASNGCVREHRLVAESTLGRYLLPSEVVHHIDDDPANNHPDNLMVYETNAVHISETMTGKVPAERIRKAQAARWKNHQPLPKNRKRRELDAQASTQTDSHSTT